MNKYLKYLPGFIKNKITIILMLVSLLIITSSWIISFINYKFSFTFINFIKIHALNPLILIIYILPVITFIIGYLYFYHQSNTEEDYNKRLKENEIKIAKMAEFAQKIGEGNFEAKLDINVDNDLLAQALLLMRDNLYLNYKKESEQSWISQGKELISNILRLHNDFETLSLEVIKNLVKYINAIQGAFYIYDEERNVLRNFATYAYNRRKFINQEFKIGYGLIGECAYERDYIYRTEIPEDYVTITSGILGDKKPQSILLIPLISDEKLQGVLEFASLEPQISETTIRLLKELGEIIARTIFNLKITKKTEQLLKEAQQMTIELQENEEQLRQNAEEMRATQEELRKANEQLEAKIKEVENAQKRLYSLLENASEIITIYDENFNMIYESPSVIKILGYTPEEMMNGKDMERLTRKGEAAMREMFKKLIEKPEEPVTIQYTYMRKDGKKIFLESTGRNMLHDPAIKGIIVNSTDITERKRAEREERLRSKMQSLSENSLDMIIRLSTAGQFFYANPVVKTYMNIDPKDLINKTLNDIECPETLYNYFKNTIDAIKSNPQKTSTEIIIPIKTENEEIERIMSIDAIPEYNENELETILFVGHDITEQKQIEREIQEKNRKIQDSINYAERIQSSILPDTKFIRTYLPKSFIFYIPRDVVSGDFPWFFKRGDDIYIAAVDCTGHGVPGALLSFIGYFSLNNIVDHEGITTASEILDKLHLTVRKTLKQEHEDAEARDGMDIAFLKINHNKKEVQFAGAHRPLYYLRNNELIEYKGDRKAIGGIPHKNKEEKNFTNYVINYKRGDRAFIFSDGITDQIGGPEEKKYSPKRVRDIIVNTANLSMDEVYKFFERDFYEWKGENKQIDDVLLIGIEF